MSLVKIPFDRDKIKLSRVYESDSLKEFEVKGLPSDKVNYVYGELKFDRIPDDRPLTLASFVTSLDGKIAFEDAPEGPFIAQKNFLDPDGAGADFWVLNMLRANCDGILVGAGTMQEEADMTAHVFDQELEDARVEAGLDEVPLNIVASLDGRDIPFDHKLFKAPEVPVAIFTSPSGMEWVKENFKEPVEIIGPYNSLEEIDKEEVTRGFKALGEKVPVIVTGSKQTTNSEVFLKVLRLAGIEKLLVESPTYTHHLIKNKLLDEMFLNYSCIYIGGKALCLGNREESFTSKDHPHSEVLSIHAHSSHFFYFRHKLLYGIKGE
ncbi:RibD family protein [Halothermothrix orenii]|uniref:Pyrimidine reductase, riboflavin biosynthesis n=1 Tax=Halothermothrix orenii (strain H 168 / OCM 544 / DSM 9562) TaxID=373903 RepID=B8CZE8_HALOH|nr:dihydrofolate reductase family protein [Halothermothrix orenii]ACL70667.1 pyrimidine reductase, riboflavin biosynthesis [Halothermothrix orenii H 168]